uniref:Uncharacterized protein n=1 Tax=Strigamia maritima TaxID=126957 RepID=T1IN10_STRMM
MLTWLVQYADNITFSYEGNLVAQKVLTNENASFPLFINPPLQTHAEGRSIIRCDVTFDERGIEIIFHHMWSTHNWQNATRIVKSVGRNQDKTNIHFELLIRLQFERSNRLDDIFMRGVTGTENVNHITMNRGKEAGRKKQYCDVKPEASYQCSTYNIANFQHCIVLYTLQYTCLLEERGAI